MTSVRPVPNVIHRACDGVVLEVDTDEWLCARCEKVLQGADCSIRYTDGEGELEIDVEKYIARGRR